MDNALRTASVRLHPLGLLDRSLVSARRIEFDKLEFGGYSPYINGKLKSILNADVPQDNSFDGTYVIFIPLKS